jgi:hypothetical protein
MQRGSTADGADAMRASHARHRWPDQRRKCMQMQLRSSMISQRFSLRFHTRFIRPTVLHPSQMPRRRQLGECLVDVHFGSGCPWATIANSWMNAIVSEAEGLGTIRSVCDNA